MPKSCPPMPGLCPKHKKRWKEFVESGGRSRFMRSGDIYGSVSNGNRMVSRVTNEICDTMSDLEYHHLIIVDNSPGVVELKTNYPCDPKVTWKCAWKLGYAHHHKEDGLVVPTVDFYFGVQVGKKVIFFARDVKRVAELFERDVLEKLQIVRTYWEDRGVNYGIWTDETLDQILAKNLAEFQGMTDPEDFQIEEKEIDLAQEYMEAHFFSATTLSELAIKCDQALGFKNLRLGASLTIAHFLILRHRWICDLREVFDPSTPETLRRITFAGKK